MRLLLSPYAATDIDGIEDYSAARWGGAQAEKYIRELRAGLDRLIQNPLLGRARKGIPPPYLLYPAASHLIIYRFDIDNDRVEVLRVLHPKMDIVRRVRETPRRNY